MNMSNFVCLNVDVPADLIPDTYTLLNSILQKESAELLRTGNRRAEGQKEQKRPRETRTSATIPCG